MRQGEEAPVRTMQVAAADEGAYLRVERQVAVMLHSAESDGPRWMNTEQVQRAAPGGGTSHRGTSACGSTSYAVSRQSYSNQVTVS